MSHIQDSILKYTLIGTIALIAVLLAITYVKRNRTQIQENVPVQAVETLNDVCIFDDIKIKTHDDAISHDSVQESFLQAPSINFIKNNVKKGDTIIHVCHGIGVQTLLMAKYAQRSGRVYLFNPCKKYADSIDESAEANDFQERIISKACGVLNRTFSGLLVHKNNFPELTGRIINASTDNIPARHSAVTIDVSSLDELLPNVQNINLIRINCYYDLDLILQGAANILSRSPKITILCDFYAKNYQESQLFNFITQKGFSIYELSEDGSFLKKLNSQNELLQIKSGCIVLRKTDHTKTKQKPTSEYAFTYQQTQGETK